MVSLTQLQQWGFKVFNRSTGYAGVAGCMHYISVDECSGGVFAPVWRQRDTGGLEDTSDLARDRRA